MRVTRSGLFGYHQARFTADRCDGLKGATANGPERASHYRTFSPGDNNLGDCSDTLGVVRGVYFDKPRNASGLATNGSPLIQYPLIPLKSATSLKEVK